jgi:hypothetical protein
VEKLFITVFLGLLQHRLEMLGNALMLLNQISTSSERVFDVKAWAERFPKSRKEAKYIAVVVPSFWKKQESGVLPCQSDCLLVPARIKSASPPLSALHSLSPTVVSTTQ